MRTAAIIILFNPNLEEVVESTHALLPVVDKLILWRNSSHDVDVSCKYRDKIEVMGDGTNRFMAEPLNEAIRYCKKNSYEYLLTMDQDSLWEDFRGFMDEVAKVKEDDIVIYSPNINGDIESDKLMLDTNHVVTSGALHKVSLVERLGGFREDYEIYWVDSEFCYWAKLKGFKIKILTKHRLIHKIGYVSPRKVLGFIGANYSPTVYYFLFRNMLWMKREYYSSVGFKTILYTLKLYVPGIVLCEDEKVKKLGKIVNAIFVGLFGSIEKREYNQGPKT